VTSDSTQSSDDAGSTSAPTASAKLAALRRSLSTFANADGLDSAQRELAYDLLADLEAVASGAPENPYLVHNLAVLVVRGFDDAAGVEHAADVAASALHLLQKGLTSDPDDLTAALAIALHGQRSKLDQSVIEQLLDSTGLPHAGDRLPAATADALAAQAGNVDGQWLASAAGRVATRLDAVLAKEPERESAATARLRLLLLAADTPVASDRNNTHQRLWTLLEDADRMFGPDAERDLLRIRAAAHQIRDRESQIARKAVSKALRTAVRHAQGATADADSIVALHGALQRRRWLKGDNAKAIGDALEAVAKRFPNDPAVLSALTDTLRATGDTDSLLEHHSDLVRRGTATDVSRDVLAKQWVKTIETGAPSGLSAEVEAWIAESFPTDVAKTLTESVGLLLMEAVSSTVGPDAAGRLAERVLLRQKQLASSKSLVVRAVQLLADAGEPERALKVGHKHLGQAGGSDLRLTLAKIHLGAGIDVGEADSVLKPLASTSGPIAAEAAALREQLHNHPDFQASLHRALLSVEARVGVGTDRAVRCRVIFPSDRYALAEMPASPAPSFYQHRYLRLMVNQKDLPDGLKVADLKKGFEFTTQIIGENDDRGDRIRVYWINGGPILPLAAKAKPERMATPKAERTERPPIEAPTAGQEAAFNVGTDQPVTVTIDRLLSRSGLLLGRAVAADGESEFPVRIGIARQFGTELLGLERYEGAVVRCLVARGPGEKIRYDAVGAAELVSEAAEGSPKRNRRQRNRKRNPASTEAPADGGNAAEETAVTDAPAGEPKPAEPTPAEPKPAEPKPAEPKPAEPKPAAPEPKPAATEPKPAEATPPPAAADATPEASNDG
jgi:hypothetical protein